MSAENTQFRNYGYDIDYILNVILKSNKIRSYFRQIKFNQDFNPKANLHGLSCQ